ncbi:aldo/keto reductase [Paenibacillus chartarius]|uniref:Aldo/keto reductase n=1 Tax=Paenibacillus chartarius TaxID=747481 RepID=A0ABV6DVD9_9BACL
MRTNRLGSSELQISEIGLGCMSLGTEEKPALRIIHEALERGVNYLDTADLYDEGRNEELVGKAVRGRRSEVVLATKVGNRIVPGKPGWTWDASKSYIMSAVKESLRRLQTDYIDLYQLHGGTLDDPIDETIEAFEELQRQGVIRYYGISSIRPNVIREYAVRSRIVSVMSQYSLLDRRPEESVLDLLEQHNISMIARGPVAKGLLADGGLSKLKPDGYLDYTADELRPLLGKFAALPHEGSLAQTAIRFSLAHPAVASAIPGASTVEQLIHNVGAARLDELRPDQIVQLKELTKANVYTSHR